MSDARVQSSGERRVCARLRLLAWAVGGAIAIWQVVVYQNWINADSISYLDLSDAVQTGEWSRLVNLTWSPLYPVLIGLLRIIVPSVAREFLVAHVATLFSFLFAFGCFDVMLQAMASHLEARIDSAATPMPRWAILSIGYALFLWASIGMLTLVYLTPDLLMSGFVYLAMALLIRISAGVDGGRTWVMLGVVLGFGYLAKAFMIPLGAAIVAMTLLLPGSMLYRVRRAGAIAVIFAIAAGPYVVAVSRLAGRITFGESGAWNTLRYVDEAGPSVYWQDKGGGVGAFLHSPKKIFERPAAYSFDRHLAVTQSLWFDPAYWIAGVRPAFHLDLQLAQLRRSADRYRPIASRLAGLAVALLVLGVIAGRRGTRRALLVFWPIWGTGVIALSAYGLVHVEERYIGAFVALLWAGVLPAFRMPVTLPRWAVPLIVGAIVLNLGWFTAVLIREDLAIEQPKTESRELEAAIALHQAGVVAGDRVARIDRLVEDGWARLARVRIIAEVQRTTTRSFWNAPPAVQRDLLEAFRSTGVKAVIALDPPDDVQGGWRQLGSTRYAVFMFPPAPAPD
jgi:hypothetical protein